MSTKDIPRVRQVLDFSDDAGGDGPLGCLLHAGKDVLERPAVLRHSLLHGPVVNSAQVAHIERDGVGHQAFLFQIRLIVFHQISVHLGEGQVPSFAEETQEAVGGSRVGLGQPFLAGLPELLGEASDKSVKAFCLVLRR